MLFHGSTPGGFYKQSAHPNQYDTNNELNKVLKEYDISVYGLELHSKIRYNSSGRDSANGYYYHLDCFMTCLPDNKILILNMDILCPESQAFLREYFEIVDLKYENYIYEAFIPNPLCIGTSENYTVLFSYRLPEKCKVLLNIHQIKFITPSTLESREKDLRETYKDLQKTTLENDFFQSVLDDYEKYYSYIINEKQHQYAAFQLISDYLDELNSETSLTKDQTNQLRNDQKEILSKLSFIKHELDEIIGV